MEEELKITNAERLNTFEHTDQIHTTIASSTMSLTTRSLRYTIYIYILMPFGDFSSATMAAMSSSNSCTPQPRGWHRDTKQSRLIQRYKRQIYRKTADISHKRHSSEQFSAWVSSELRTDHLLWEGVDSISELSKTPTDTWDIEVLDAVSDVVVTYRCNTSAFNLVLHTSGDVSSHAVKIINAFSSISNLNLQSIQESCVITEDSDGRAAYPPQRGPYRAG